MSTIQSVRGMNDFLPAEARLFLALSHQISTLLSDYQFEPLILPIIEKTELFSRGIGSGTDIIDKEMYTFLDRNDESLSLRPEGTASVVRSALEHGLIHNQIRKFWYQGPMFRYERPQKGRYRQFYHMGAEIFGLASPDIEAETLAMLYHIWKKLGLDSALNLEINTIGTSEERLTFRKALVHFLTPLKNQLDSDSQKRLAVNPLRILDSKDENTQILLKSAPKLLDFISSPSRLHFETLQTYLTTLHIPFSLNPNLVRGLDYYSHTVFEWTTTQLGAQGTVCAGGRYDSLVNQLGGKNTPAFGFAIGMDRLLLLASNKMPALSNAQPPDLYITLEAGQEKNGFEISHLLRSAGLHVAMNMGGGSLKSQMKRAEQSGAKLALLLPTASPLPHQNLIEIRDLRNHQTSQKTVPAELLEYLTYSLKQ